MSVKLSVNGQKREVKENLFILICPGRGLNSISGIANGVLPIEPPSLVGIPVYYFAPFDKKFEYFLSSRYLQKNQFLLII